MGKRVSPDDSQARAPLPGRDLVRRLFVVRLWTQIIAMVSLFFTAMYGMYFAISTQQFF